MNEKSVTVNVGRYNTLRVLRSVDFGLYLDGGKYGDILMPKRYVSAQTQIGDMVDVFVYFDSEDRIVATTEKPYAQVGQFACLRVKAVNQHGAFLDWGLAKDLLVPYNQQRSRMQPDRSYIVYIYEDENSGRIAATEKYARYLDNVYPQYEQGEAVDALVCERTPMGYKTIINQQHTGLIYADEVHVNLTKGQTIRAYIKKVRDDDKIDLSLSPIGYAKVDELKNIIIRKLKENNGHMPVGDKTDPEIIRMAFGCSKKAFKMAIGTLYREKKIEITPQGISLQR